MALNFLDSLSTTATTPEKNTLSLKSKDSPGAGTMDFGQLLGGLMNPAHAQALAGTDGTAENTGDKETPAGQKIAIPSSDVTDPGAPAALLAVNVTPPGVAPVPAPASEAISIAAKGVASGASAVTAPLLAAAAAPATATAPANATAAAPTPSSAMPAPAHPQLTALVLSRNMTAITPSQSVADGDSLVAFAKSQGLDETVAAWLLAAGKGKAPSPTAGPSHSDAASPTVTAKPTETPAEASEEPLALDDPALANAALAIGLLAAPRAVATPALGSSAPAEAAPTPVQLMPMATPAAWLTSRPAVAGKSAQTAPTLPQASGDKNDMHTSDLDLSQIFGHGKDPVKTAPLPPASFTPAAWVMAGLANPAEQSTAILGASTLAKSLSLDQAAGDGSAQVNALSHGGSERSAGKLSDPLNGSAAAKGSESSMTTAERTELHQGQAEKMGQAIGLRMLSEMEKGHWHLKMMLKPANLGNIEVEMRMRNGELDANFTATQLTTRDLLQDGLPKLKDTLNQMGMDVASMNIGGGSNPKNGGDPTPQQMPTVNPAAKIEHPEEPTTIERAQVTPSSQDGLDVLV